MQHVEDIQRLAGEAKTRIKEISPVEADLQVAAGAVIIDVRDEKEFRASHLPGAINISREDLERRIAEAAPDSATPIVAYCYLGFRSAIAADTLQNLGYTKVTSLAGGLKAYLEDSNSNARKIA